MTGIRVPSKGHWQPAERPTKETILLRVQPIPHEKDPGERNTPGPCSGIYSRAAFEFSTFCQTGLERFGYGPLPEAKNPSANCQPCASPVLNQLYVSA